MENSARDINQPITATKSRRVLEFWRNLEFFQPFDLDEVIRNEDDAVYFSLRDMDKPVPWGNLADWQLDPEYEYSFDFFLGIFAKNEITKILKIKYPGILFAENFNEAEELDGTTCVVRITIDDAGVLQRDLKISTLPWALDKLRANKNLLLDDFDLYACELSLNLETSTPPFDLENNKIPPLNWMHLEDLLEVAKDKLNLNWKEFGHKCVLVPHKLKKRKLNDAGEELAAQLEKKKPTRVKRRYEILNSFYLNDLQRISQSLKNTDNSHAVLEKYLSGGIEVNLKLDLFKPSKELWEMLSPTKVPLGHWPFPEDHHMTLMQQLAINEAASKKHAFLAVNGPPGTGKTTLIKDLIAGLVVERALELAKLKTPQDAFLAVKKEVELNGRCLKIPQLKPELTGFEILVVSANNNAVENISRELPKKTSLGEVYLEQASFLPEVSALLEEVSTSNQTNWGLVSVPLGNRSNRDKFCQALIFGPKETKEEKETRRAEKNLLTLHEWRADVPKSGIISFARAKLQFLEKLELVRQEIHQAELLEKEFFTATKPSEALLKKLKDLEINFPDNENFQSLVTQQKAPWLSKNLLNLRAELFLAALKLHESWLREAQGISEAASALAAILQYPDALSLSEAKPLWQLLFMIVPVVSSTLASVERMCASLGPQSLGFVIIDEAGQATPQAGIGALWRAKNALIVGDPLQIEPVLQIPAELVRHFFKEMQVENLSFSPLSSSLQSLADSASSLGAEISTSSSQTWVGCPLRVHRRCAEPMFSISNTIAYGGMMINARPENTCQMELPESCWFDISGTASYRHWVSEQGEFLKNLLLSICDKDKELPDLFIITPFRSVRQKLQQIIPTNLREQGFSAEYAQTLKRCIGTVHTFQGKEASIVFFVLGCDARNAGAMTWAGQKPNLLNVATTRAKDRFYVIGDLEIWHNRGFFSELATVLKRKKEI